MARTLTAEQVSDLFASALKRNPSAASPDEAEVRDLTYWINVYLSKPWTASGVAAYRRQDRRSREQRKILDEAAEILTCDLNSWVDSLMGVDSVIGSSFIEVSRKQIADLRTAIMTLSKPRSSFEHGLRRTGKTGPDPKPWSFVASTIASEALIALQKAQRRQMQSVQEGFGDRDGPIVRFVSSVLKQIFSPTEVPENGTILETLEAAIPSKAA